MINFIKCLIILVICVKIRNVQSTESELNALALKNLKEYLQIPSVQPNVNYGPCVNFLKKQADSLDLPVKVVELHPKKPIVIITWEGTEPEKPSILLNGHMDVVPVFPEEWTYPPFGAEMDEKGNIYARGSQDMKGHSIQQIEAIRRLKLKGIRLKRTIHLSFVPDEEIGGLTGMKTFIFSTEFKSLNVGFAMDEGDFSTENKFLVSYGEKSWFQIWINCQGDPGHGSSLLNNTASEKLRFIIDRFMDFRASEKAKLQDPNVKAGNVTSINLTMMKGGTQINVVANELSVAFDIRLPPQVNHEEFENMINDWCKEAGDGVYYTIINKDPPIENTKIDDSNIYWVAFKNATDHLGMEVEPFIMTGVTDARFLRLVGIPALGFVTIHNTPHLAHASNEYLNKDIFLQGIDIFMKIIPAVASA
ncbi:aminoacylase-1-like [Leptopilina heterotoma]|uniref:aminoacylase-1-like n=1 Tax=Leptopilina heterotoma TaxID=63436 RepID=UPI001CA87EB8|nr:aminoacylase-1-like [Leptopilina heterotoma]